MSDPDLQVMLRHRYGDQRRPARRHEYVSGRAGRFRNWLLTDDDPALRPAPCRMLAPSGEMAPEAAPETVPEARGGARPPCAGAPGCPGSGYSGFGRRDRPGRGG